MYRAKRLTPIGTSDNSCVTLSECSLSAPLKFELQGRLSMITLCMLQIKIITSAKRVVTGPSKINCRWGVQGVNVQAELIAKSMTFRYFKKDETVQFGIDLYLNRMM